MTTKPDGGTTSAVSAIPANRRGLSLAVLAGALGLDLSGLGVLNAALPEIGANFELSNATLQWVMTSYAVAFAGFLLFGGRASDVLGRRMMFTVGVGLFTVAALAGALAPTITVLIVARAAQGIGAALSGPATLALIAEVFPEGPERNRAFGIYASVGAASFSGGVVLGGVLTSALGWRTVLLFSTVIGLVVLAGVKAGLPRSTRQRSPLDLPGAVMVTAGLVLAVFAVSHGAEAGWGATSVVVSLVLAVVLLIGFVVWELRAKDPLLPLSIFRSNPVRISSLAAILNYTGGVGLLFFAPLYMQGMLDYPPFLSGLAVLPSSAALFVTATFFTGKLLGKYSPRPVMAVGLALIALSMLLWMFTPLDGNYWIHLLPGFIVTGIGQGLVFPAMTVGSLTGVPPQQHGVAGAVNVTAQQIGSSVGVAALVVVATGFAGAGLQGQLDGFHSAYLAAAAVCLLGGLIALVSRKGWSGDQS